MYILTEARYEKKTRRLLPGKNGNTKLWAYPPALFNNRENAERAMGRNVTDVVNNAKAKGTFKKVHVSTSIKVVECTDCIKIFRISENNPEDEF